MALHIAVVVGSLRRESFNRQLAQAVISLAPPELTFEFIDIGSLPLYSQEYDADFPEVARQLKQRVEAADGLLFASPEYNYSVSGVLKNTIDWVSRIKDQPFAGKPVALQSVADHDDILAALRRGDADAACAAMQRNWEWPHTTSPAPSSKD